MPRTIREALKWKLSTSCEGRGQKKQVSSSSSLQLVTSQCNMKLLLVTVGRPGEREGSNMATEGPLGHLSCSDAYWKVLCQQVCMQECKNSRAKVPRLLS